MWPRFLISVLKAVIVWTLYERKSREKCKYGFLLVETYCRQTRRGRGEDAGLRAALWQNRVRKDPNSTGVTPVSHSSSRASFASNRSSLSTRGKNKVKFTCY